MLVPKKVEFFQDKVKAVPEQTAREQETQRQAAHRTYEKSQQALSSALVEGCSTNVVMPASETVVLAKAVSTSVGPPLAPSTLPSKELAAKLDTAGAALDRRLEAFKEDNNENTGKKIEGTGLFSVPYLVVLGAALLGIFVIIIFVGLAWTAVKLYALSNPPLALGLKAVQTSASFAKQALSEVLKGGEEFKKAVKTVVADPALQQQVLDLFRVNQERAQAPTTQDVIKELTTK